MTLAEINHRIRRVKRKLVRWGLGLETAHRRIRHFKRREHHFAEERDKAKKRGEKSRAETVERRRQRAHRYKRRWQKRQQWIASKHKYLQLVLDRRQRRKAKWLDEHPQEKYPETGLTEFDGHQCAAWIIHDICAPAREAGDWNGYIISGWRDPRYSRELCEHICGHPTCSGICAGEGSRHSQYVKPDGAVDVTDPAGLIAYCRRKGINFHGNGEMLPSDRPHCSTWGN